MLSVGTLLTVLGLLSGRAAAVRACDVFLLLGLGLHLTFVRVFAFTAPTEVDAILED